MDDFSHLPERDGRAATPSMADFDEAEFLPYLDDMDLSEVQKSEFMHVLWDIMRMFVEIDMPVEIWGQIVEPLIDPTNSDSDEVKSS